MRLELLLKNLTACLIEVNKSVKFDRLINNIAILAPHGEKLYVEIQLVNIQSDQRAPINRLYAHHFIGQLGPNQIVCANRK